MSEVTVQDLEQYIEQRKEVIAFADAIVRLQDVPDFKRVINEGFCEKAAAHYVRESGDPALSAENRADSLAMAQAAGHLQRFLSVSVRMGNEAEREIEGAKHQIDQLRSEGN